MTSRLAALCIDANEPPRLAHFWASLLGREIAADRVTLESSDHVGFDIQFRAIQEPKAAPNQMHL